ncbi:class I SAM-dependent methyltransferase [Saccharopolyspora shandongensis]|uniref:class I SAM-dependent methyltransferase n=1 Tax=Saccharopolyspora shandongensis TaxID=418495 RepID=UPI0033EB92A3
MKLINDRTGYWDHYAAGVADQDQEKALKEAFGWCQYANHGPGDELLGDSLTALELGSGRGNAVAALAVKGIDTTGVDLSPTQCDAASAVWDRIPGARFIQADGIEFLSTTDQQWDAIYSIWGGIWFSDPEVLLPLIRARLTANGTLAFAHAPAVPGSTGIQGMYGNGFKGKQVWIYRWAYEPETWETILRDHGFTEVSAWIEPAPEPDHVGTLIVRARA